MRVTKYTLREQCVKLNEWLRRPHGAMEIGHFSIDKNASGYRLEEEVNGKGVVQAHSERLPAREMGYLLAGMIRGVSLGRTMRT